MPQKAKYVIPNQEELVKEIGKKIASIRKSKGLTQQELAGKVGINQTLISHYEIGRLKISSEILLLIAKSLNTSSDEILGLKELSNISKPSRKIMKRLKEIESLSEGEQKTILRSLDMMIKAAKQE